MGLGHLLHAVLDGLGNSDVDWIDMGRACALAKLAVCIEMGRKLREVTRGNDFYR